MNEFELLEACKLGLSISGDDFNQLLLQKILAVKAFMTNAGISSENLDNDLTVGVIVMGVSDLWELKSGEVKFSPVFFTLVTQLASR